MSHEPANEYSKLSDEHLAAFRLAVREKRSLDATREMRLHTTALNAARAISDYLHERGKK